MGIDKHKRNYDLMKKQMDHEIKRNRDMSVKELKEHVANLKYRPHINDRKDFLKVTINLFNKIYIGSAIGRDTEAKRRQVENGGQSWQLCKVCERNVLA